jgi:quinolinate synthase
MSEALVIPEYILVHPEVQRALHDLKEAQSKRRRVIEDADRDVEMAVVTVREVTRKLRREYRRTITDLEALGISARDGEDA